MTRGVSLVVDQGGVSLVVDQGTMAKEGPFLRKQYKEKNILYIYNIIRYIWSRGTINVF